MNYNKAQFYTAVDISRNEYFKMTLKHSKGHFEKRKELKIGRFFGKNKFLAF